MNDQAANAHEPCAFILQGFQIPSIDEVAHLSIPEKRLLFDIFWACFQIP